MTESKPLWPCVPAAQAARPQPRFSRLSIVHLRKLAPLRCYRGGSFTLQPANCTPTTTSLPAFLQPPRPSTHPPADLTAARKSSPDKDFLRFGHISRLGSPIANTPRQDTAGRGTAQRQQTQEQTRKRYAPNTTSSCQPTPAQRHPATTATKPHTSITSILKQPGRVQAAQSLLARRSAVQ